MNGKKMSYKKKLKTRERRKKIQKKLVERKKNRKWIMRKQKYIESTRETEIKNDGHYLNILR